MASQLKNLFKTLTWADFTRRPLTPKPNQTIHLAATGAMIKPTLSNPTIIPVPGSKPTTYTLSDNVVISIEFDRVNSWVSDWVFTQSPTFQSNLLNHEQGHYNLIALIARDLFVDLMLLKQQRFASAADGISAIRALIAPLQTTPHIVQKVTTLYDSAQQTNNGQDSVAQARWDGHIRTAFTQERSTGTAAPDGTTHKVRILDVLHGAGIKP